MKCLKGGTILLVGDVKYPLGEDSEMHNHSNRF